MGPLQNSLLLQVFPRFINAFSPFQSPDCYTVLLPLSSALSSLMATWLTLSCHTGLNQYVTTFPEDSV